MIFTTRAIAVAIIIVAMALFWAEPSRSQPREATDAAVEAIIRDYLAKHPEEIERIVSDYLVKHPEVLQSSIAELLKRRKPTNADKTVAIKSNADALFSSIHQVTLGNPNGDVTMVEFFDYNCGYCKRALSDLIVLLKDDPKLKVVLKEFPILGPGSMETARVAVAVHMQDPSGEKYLAFHQQLLGSRGPANKDSALAAAKEVGLDMTRLEQDIASDEVRETLAESVRLAQSLGINGTPGYVIGDGVVPGAIGAPGLKERIQGARGRRGG
jgi:protein-disulfide isomerase